MLLVSLGLKHEIQLRSSVTSTCLVPRTQSPFGNRRFQAQTAIMVQFLILLWVSFHCNTLTMVMYFMARRRICRIRGFAFMRYINPRLTLTNVTYTITEAAGFVYWPHVRQASVS